MFAALLLAGIFAARLATVALFASANQPPAAPAPWSGRHLLAQAVARAAAEPTYYGDAWVALGGWLLGNGLHC